MTTASSTVHPQETAFAFDCEGSTLVGVIHEAEGSPDLGLLTIVAGGPQYRGGCGRQLVELGRRLAPEGVPVMRFDHRGLGDSSGSFAGFQHLRGDIEAAISEFRKRVPSIRRIVLWGGCDAASAALLNAGSLPDVTAIIASNPWISTEETATRARRKHYLSRLTDKSFWRKVFRLEYNPLDYIKEAVTRLRRKRQSAVQRNKAAAAKPYLEMMLEGLTAFQGSVLFIMSGRSIISRQFDELLRSDQRWSSALHSGRCERVDIAEADQTFSNRAAREALLETASTWLAKNR